MGVNVRAAAADDAERIHATLRANAADPSLFQQPLRRVRENLREFVVAEDAGHVVGCAQLHRSREHLEILAVAVAPEAHGRGVGGALMRACVDRATTAGAQVLWLATAKPAYFARFGFVPITKWRLPLRVLLGKLRLIFDQPARRWLPALFGRHTFMRMP